MLAFINMQMRVTASDRACKTLVVGDAERDCGCYFCIIILQLWKAGDKFMQNTGYTCYSAATLPCSIWRENSSSRKQCPCLIKRVVCTTFAPVFVCVCNFRRSLATCNLLVHNLLACEIVLAQAIRLPSQSGLYSKMGMAVMVGTALLPLPCTILLCSICSTLVAMLETFCAIAWILSTRPAGWNLQNQQQTKTKQTL